MFLQYRFPGLGNRDPKSRDPDGLAGAFGDWRTGESRTWSGAPMDPESRRRLQEKIEEARREREAEEAQQTLKPLPPATAENPYLARKGVKPCEGLKAERRWWCRFMALAAEL